MGKQDGKTTRIYQKKVEWPHEPTGLYWNGTKREWTPGDGTRYKSIQQAEAEIKRHKLTNCWICS